MNSKNLKYLLVVLLILTWGIIFKKIIAAFFTDNQISYIPGNRSSFNYNTDIDSFSLHANYPDPFLYTEIDVMDTTINTSDSSNVALNKHSTEIRTIKTDTNSTSQILFLGIIKNPEKNKSIAIININGTEYLGQMGEKIGEYKIKYINKDHIVLISHGSEIHVKSQKQ